MSDTTLLLEEYRKMVIGANHYFYREKDNINALNVFPVPDGDTGTNMSLTLEAAARGAREYRGDSLGELAETVARHALMGARGNSGVILSQLLRGFARGVSHKEGIDSSDLSKAFQYGIVYAYKAVSRPVEGTILTVARDIARGSRSAIRKGEDIYGILKAAIGSGEKSLLRTVDMLPTLQEAGVVDAGGKGLVVFLIGCLQALQTPLEEIISETEKINAGASNATPSASSTAAGEAFSLEHPYCTELIIKNNGESFAGLSSTLSSLGESMLVVDDHKLCKIHIHTCSPDMVLKECLAYGSLHDIKIDNMMDQHRESLTSEETSETATPVYSPAPETTFKETGIIAVSFGEGINNIFFNLGVERVIYGGQTMNPKVEELLEAIHASPQEKLIVLPNNKNIELVAEQASKHAHKEVEVLKTRNIPEGIAALMAYQPGLGIQENLEAMQESKNMVKAGEVTYAIRETNKGNSNIEKGSYLGVCQGEIYSWGNDLVIATLELLKSILEDEDELVSLLYGEEINEIEANSIKETIEEAFPFVEVELHYGGQPVYYFIISLE